MNALNLTHEEALRIFHSCQWLRLTGGPVHAPAFLQEFIACRLASTDPALAARVRRLTRPEVESLYAEVKEQQCLADHLLLD
jgi:hypothetical protein